MKKRRKREKRKKAMIRTIITTITNDAAEAWQLGFQDSASPIAEGILNLHNEILYYLLIILVLICWVMTSIIIKFNENTNKFTYKYLNHGTLIELIWTITPALILMAIAIPSFKLLYLMDEVVEPTITLKVTGHQWYWSTEYSDYGNESDNIEFDSYMVPTADLELGTLRLLEVDNRVVVPVDTNVRVIVTSTDVIHSLALPSLGVKIDCIPGRLNQSSFLIKREGVYYGQCSELCGVMHGFMPIVVEGVSLEKYLAWLNEELGTEG
uniref:cytochrome c oxidase subunit 2 n=1 Tax=Conidiobolus mycophagus TaxID=1368622 RepID=UPI001D12DDED|nr:cytochrome c oxidase subunit 2 [Conidiobolus mycophagus]QZZ81337.1 cytochrome c oxidase subunit 2 [Conidiobolus mycophagus]